MRVPVVLLDPDLPVPRPALPGDAGLDLRAREARRVPSGGRCEVATGVAIALPDGVVGLIVPRSGIAAKHGVTVLNSPGVVDSGYRGEIIVLLANTGESDFSIARGDRVAQLLLVSVLDAQWDLVSDLSPTARGRGGLGHTGRE